MRTIRVRATPALAVLLVVAASTAWGSTTAEDRQAGSEGDRPAPLAETFYGYEPGEERRYRIGPPEELAPGESAEWEIRYEGIEDDPTFGPVARFAFGHHRFELVPGSWGPAEEIMEVRVTGVALLSRDAFPLDVRYEQHFLSGGETTSGSARRNLRFLFDRETRRYTKYLEMDRRDWDFRFAIPSHDDVDGEALRGLYLFMPSALGCIGTSRGTCIEAEPAFTNPGFLSMVLPFLLEEEKSERDFYFFMPAGIGSTPFRPTMPSRWLSRERDNLRSQDRYFERWKMKLGASEEVEVGPRQLHAWEMELGGGIDRIWIEPSGRVVRIDLETTWSNTDDRHIRLVFPFEEFLSPNDDPAEECCR